MANLKSLKRQKKRPKTVWDNNKLVHIFFCYFKSCKYLLKQNKIIIGNVWFCFYLLLMNKFCKKEKRNRLQNFPAGYVGSFYRNLADNVDNFVGSDFYMNSCRFWYSNWRCAKIYPCNVGFCKEYSGRYKSLCY